MKLTKTDRGFLRFVFTDLSGAESYLQESSLATKEAVWIYSKNDDAKGMIHIDRKLARKLWPLLKDFADNGDQKTWGKRKKNHEPRSDELC